MQLMNLDGGACRMKGESGIRWLTMWAEAIIILVYLDWRVRQTIDC